MKKNVIGVFIVLMLLMPSSTAMFDSSLESDDVIKSQNTVNNDGLPDLIITDIFAVKVDTEDPWYYMDGLKITIKNIGNTTIPSNANSTVHYVVTKLLFGIFPIKVVEDEVWVTIPDFNLHPGASKELVINDGWTNSLTIWEDWDF